MFDKSAPEALVYEIEVVEVVSPPQVAKQAKDGDGGPSKAIGSTGTTAGSARSEVVPTRSIDTSGRSDAAAHAH